VRDLSCAPSPADPRNAELHRAGGKAVLAGPSSPPALPFEVVESKIQVPLLPVGTVSRTALVNRLRAAGAFPLVLVVAPAGYGKTTLLAQWARRDVRPFAWVSIDEYDNDPVAFLRHVAAALDRGEPIPASALEPLRLDEEAAFTKALPRLAEAITSRRSPFVLVLDGADLLTRDSIGVVAELVKHIPVGSMIVLSGRVLPNLPVAALRAGGPLLEIGPYELALSRREAEILLRAARVELPDEEITELVLRTEGWAAGLYLAVLASLDESGVETGKPQDILSIAGDDRYFADYFRSEYLSRLAPERLTFLRRTSVLETMSGPLCDAVLEQKESALELATLEAANLFVVPLDRHRGSYRYHHLFRDLLQRELEEREPELVPVLNQRAADWFEAQGDAESTLHYSHGAGNKDSAARILSSIAMSVSSTGRMTAVESWLDQFDDEAQLHHYPGVAVEGSRIHAFRGRPAEAAAWLAAAERGVPANGEGGTTRACIDVLRAAMCADGPERMLADTESALAELSPDHPWHPWALVVNGTAHLLLGEGERADRALAKAAEASNRLGRAESRSLALSERSLLATARDDDEAETLALEAHRLIEDGELDAYATSALDLAATARALLRHGRWDEARRQLTITQRLAPSLTHAIPWLSVQVRLELGHAYVTLRDHERARGLLDEAKEILHLRPSLGVLGDQVAELEVEIEAMPQAAAGGSSGLTPAELRLLPLLSTHLSFREIGEQLFVSRNTIKTQAISVYRKLGVSGRSEAITRAGEIGLVGGAAPPPAAPLAGHAQSASF
jgi:LuxR family transcriptional regulator, maltose regulon positive regulatory protein